MIEYFVICGAALAGSILTFFSGFGLGTVLLPVFGIFFPIEAAITMTALVHFSNNLFKLMLTYRNVDKQIFIRFGIPSIFAALAGAYLLITISDIGGIFSYSVGGSEFIIYPVKVVVAFLLIFFASFDILPLFKKIMIGDVYMPLGGILSGFFGGLSGHQGALRSAFLIRSGMSKESFIATGVLIACCVDISRLSVYAGMLDSALIPQNKSLLLAAVVSAFIGAMAGSRMLKKVAYKWIEKLVAFMLIVFAVLLGAGVI